MRIIYIVRKGFLSNPRHQKEESYLFGSSQSVSVSEKLSELYMDSHTNTNADRYDEIS